MSQRNEIAFKIDFLRAMVPVMTETDMDAFTNICKNFSEGKAFLADLVLLDQLFEKFDKPAGKEKI